MDSVESLDVSQTDEIIDSQALSYSFEKDFDFVKKHAGNKDPEYLQFLLKCEMDNPKRLETVMCDALNIPNAAELIKKFRKNYLSSPDTSKHLIDDSFESCSENKKRKIENEDSYLKNILEMFPDADENFLLNECSSLDSWEDYSRFINTVMISGMYTKKGAKNCQSENEKTIDISSANDSEANQTIDSEISLLWEKNINEDLYVIESPKKTEEQIKLNTIREIEELESSLNYQQTGRINQNNETDITSDIIFDYMNETEEHFRKQKLFEHLRKNSILAAEKTNMSRSSAVERGFRYSDDEKSLAEIIEESRRSRRSLDSQRQRLLNFLENSPSDPGIAQSSMNSPIRNVGDSVFEDLNKTESPNLSEFDFGDEGEISTEVSEDWINEQTENLIRIFPQTDPSYLREEILKMNGSTKSVNAFVIEKLEKNNMPTRRDFEKKLEMEELQNRYTKNFSIEHFLKVIPEPWKYFKEGNRNCVKYKDHSLCYLKSAFRKHYVRDIIDVFKKNNYNLYSSFKHLTNTESRKRSSRRSEFECNIDRPTIIDIQFLQEVAFIENETKIKNFIQNAKKMKSLKFEEAKLNGSLLECQCCFDCEIMVEDTVYCPKDHSFCKDCVTRSVEVEMGNGKCQFECLTNCDEKFTLTCLQNVLSPELFSKVIQAVQIEEIKAAEIEDLVQCPFCNYATIMPPEEKVLVCLNPECLKESCRLCREISHIPLRCDEVEKLDEVKIRTYIENKMTEALIRTCYKCNKKFVKEDGCNKMTCTCGAKMCYVCRKPVTDYSHFNGQGGTEYHKCPLYSTNDELHVDLVTQIGMEAKAEILEANPGGRLLHDPTLILPERSHDRKTPGMNNGAALNFGLELKFLKIPLKNIIELELQKKNFKNSGSFLLNNVTPLKESRAIRESMKSTKARPKRTSSSDDEIQELMTWIPNVPELVQKFENNGKGNNYLRYEERVNDYHHNHHRHHSRHHNHHHHHRYHEDFHNSQHQHHHHH